MKLSAKTKAFSELRRGLPQVWEGKLSPGRGFRLFIPGFRSVLNRRPLFRRSQDGKANRRRDTIDAAVAATNLMEGTQTIIRVEEGEDEQEGDRIAADHA